MPSERQCESARQITGSRTSSSDINIHYSTTGSSNRFLLARAIDRFLKTHDTTEQEGWKTYKTELDDIALDYLVDPATAFCIYEDWKATQESKKND